MNADSEVGVCVCCVEVRRRTVRRSMAYQCSATLGVDYARFSRDVRLRLDVAASLARGFGDPDPRLLAVTGVSPGSVELRWTNSSVSGGGVCPLSVLADIRARMLGPDGAVNPAFRDAVRPYRLLRASLTPRGACVAGPRAVTTGRPPEPVPAGVSDDRRGLLVNVVVPILIVLLCVLLALVIACVLIRRRRRREEKGSSPAAAAVKPGAPVIFASELDDNGPAAPPSRPLIGGPAPGGARAPAPPDYLAATAGTPPVHDHRRPLLAGDPGAAGDQMSPLRFHPPPGSAVKQSALHSSSRR